MDTKSRNDQKTKVYKLVYNDGKLHVEEFNTAEIRLISAALIEYHGNVMNNEELFKTKTEAEDAINKNLWFNSCRFNGEKLINMYC